MALTDSLEAYWKLEEASGSRADSSGNSRTLTDNNTVTQATGKLGNAAQFVRANTEYLSRSDEAGLSFAQNVDLTVMAWVYLDSIGTLHNLVVKGNAGAEYGLQVTTAGKAQFNLSTGLVLHATVLSTATWYLLFGWYDNVADKSWIRVSGVGSDASATDTSGSADQVGDFRLGRAGSTYMDGRLDSVGIWRRALSTTEMDNLYNSGTGKEYPWGNTYTQDLTDSVTISEARTIALGNTKADACTIAEARSMAIGRTLTESVALTEARTIALGRTLTETVTLTETLIRSASLTLTEAVTLNDTLQRALGVLLTETLGVSEARTIALVNTLVESLVVGDGRSIALAHTLADSVTIGDDLTLLVAAIIQRVLGPRTLLLSPRRRTTLLSPRRKTRPI